ncbi:unnamed protein product [marine sediment metagenome]|uniref:Uncharacterized protein n=1 Tax=marine sediment metagenome TaxID=412755 RepID=X1RFJ0_9ZZZZ
MIKTLDLTLGQIGVAQTNPLGIAVPDVAPGVYATGYYTDEATGIQYYYDAPNNQWYYSAAGYIYALERTWQPSPSPIINIAAGDTLRCILDFYFAGPKLVTQKFKAFIGDNTKEGGFGEWDNFWGTNDIEVPASDTPLHHGNYYVDIIIPSGHEGKDGAAYCKKRPIISRGGKRYHPLLL